MAKKKKSNSSKKNFNFGILCESQEPDEDGNPRYYIKLSKDASDFSAGGHDFDTQYINLQSPAQKFGGLLKYGVIDEEEYEENMEKYEEGGEFEGIKYFVSVKL